MSALTKNRDTPCREGKDFAFEAAAVVYQGSMVALDASGKAIPAESTGNVAVGVAQNPAAAGERVHVARGVFRLANSAGAEAIALTDVGNTCFVADDQTVKKTGTGAVAGKIMDVDAQGVWVKL